MKKKSKKIVWHIRFNEYGIRQFFPAYRKYNEADLAIIPNEYWQDDPICHIKIK